MRLVQHAGARSARVGLWLVAGTLLAAVAGLTGRPSLAQDPEATAGVTCETVRVPMRDGVVLATDVYRPAVPGRYPVILQRTPYGFRLGQGCFSSGLSGAMAFWAEHGYVAVSQDARGTFRSEGVFRPIFQEQEDGYDAVEWAAAQPWSNGRVAMTGTSYMGVTQWQAALTTPPHLVAIAPGQTATDYHDHWTYVNGVFDLWFGQSWPLAFFAPDAQRRRLIAGGASGTEAERAAAAWLADGERRIARDWIDRVPLADFADFRELAPYYYEWLAHPNYDEYWAAVDVEAQWEKITVPALVTGAWGDLFHIGSVRGFNGMRARAGSDAARAGTMLVMTGGGGHGREGAVSFGEAGERDLRELRLRFYDHHVKGISNGIDREPRVQLFVQAPPDSGVEGTGFWIEGDAFPPAGADAVRFNLASGGRANSRWGDGVLARNEPPRGPGDSFTYDPRDPVPALGGGLCCLTLGFYFRSGAQDQSTVERRDDVLVYTSAPLAEDMAVIGPVTVRLWATTTARDTDFTAKLVDVHPDGFAQNILNRVVRARFRNGSKAPPSLVEPGRAYEYEIDLGYTANVFRAGHRVRLDVSSSEFPHLARNHNTGADPATDGRFAAAVQTVHHDAARPSHLELTVAPGVAAGGR
ncbi:MAG: CocE/NonD family hydrolase [Acidobacteria bacterium]|nr:CocE/NonD family hydrolase [Acidobacteriota bacterium]